jgi:magnesium transporter
VAYRTERTIRAINETLVDRYPGEAARSLENLPPAEILGFLTRQTPARGAAVLERLAPDSAADVLEKMDPELARPMLPLVDAARVAALLARLDENGRQRHLAVLEPPLRGEIQALIDYPLDSAGHLMDPRVTGFRVDDTVQDVLERMRRLRGRPVHYVFVIDEEGRLMGAVPIQDLALAAPEERAGALVRAAPARVQATASRDEVLEELQTRRVSSLPVVDWDDRLLGVIRHNELVAAVQAEASVDIQTMVGASREERALSPWLFAVRKRLPWLEVNLATAFLAASVVGLFEETIAKYTALAVLLPVVAGQSGNTGAQALAVTMRGLALREIRARHGFKVAVKEVLAAAINGVVVGLTTAVAVYLWSGSAGLMLIIGVSMVASMTIAGLAGALIPIILTTLGQDPAQSSSIVLTTVTDVAGFFSFLGIATTLSFML